MLGLVTLWSEYIQRSKRSNAHKFPPVCLLVTESDHLPFAHTKQTPWKKTWPSGIMVNFQLTKRQSETKIPKTFQWCPHLNTNAFKSTYKSYKFPSFPFHSCDLLEIALALGCQLRPWLQHHFHNAGQLDAVTLAHLIKPISVWVMFGT